MCMCNDKNTLLDAVFVVYPLPFVFQIVLYLKKKIKKNAKIIWVKKSAMDHNEIGILKCIKYCCILTYSAVVNAYCVPFLSDQFMHFVPALRSCCHCDSHVGLLYIENIAYTYFRSHCTSYFVS